jgi:hypothetical protein
MQNLEKRIAALEQASPQAYSVVFVILTGLGEVDKELAHIYDSHNNQWHRKPNETEREFKDRATTETPRKENGVALLFGECSLKD